MSIFEILFIAVALSMDAFAVSIAGGIGLRPFHWGKAAKMALFFGGFQALMPILGWLAGAAFKKTIILYAPWIALILLAFIGGKMILESFNKDEECEQHATWTLPFLLTMAVATSIDALATGVIFIPGPEMLWTGIGLIAIVSFLLSIAGCYIGSVFGKRFNFNVELLGGIILIGIGLKIWIEGVCF